jgi:pimeloyl-ACP methyl ester carboxylesterase
MRSLCCSERSASGQLWPFVSKQDQVRPGRRFRADSGLTAAARAGRVWLRQNGPSRSPVMSNTAMARLRDGSKLWTTVSGTGPPVVCLHGGPGLWDYLAPLAALLDDTFTVARFDQRGCGRSTADGGPFTIEQAVDDMDHVRAAFGFERWALAGHSWGAELALRYAALHPGRTTTVAYIAGVGAGNGFRDAFAAEQDRRLGRDRERLAELSAIPAGDRTLAEERERCMLQWRPDFAQTSDTARHAVAGMVPGLRTYHDRARRGRAIGHPQGRRDGSAAAAVRRAHGLRAGHAGRH